MEKSVRSFQLFHSPLIDKKIIYCVVVDDYCSITELDDRTKDVPVIRKMLKKESQRRVHMVFNPR